MTGAGTASRVSIPNNAGMSSPMPKSRRVISELSSRLFAPHSWILKQAKQGGMHVAYELVCCLPAIYRPDQIMLQDDPAFLPELAFRALDIDLSALDLSSDAVSHDSSLMSRRSLLSSQSSHGELEGPHLGLVIPTSDTGGAADFGGFAIPSDNDDPAQRGSRLGGPIFGGDEEGFLPDVDFEFDAEGNVVELNAEDRAQRQSATGVGGSRLSKDSAASARVRREHEEGLQAMAQLGVSLGCFKESFGTNANRFRPNAR